MDNLAEQIVAMYLTQGGKVFIVPQYSIPGPSGNGEWACPNFVALDFGEKKVVVVEVATGSRFAGLIQRVAERETRWFQPIKNKLEADGLLEQATWDIRFLGFVRKDSLHLAEGPFVGQPKVAFKAIEDVTFPWAYWSERAAKGIG